MNRLFHRVVLLLVAAFPIAVLWIPHGGSSIFWSLAFLGLIRTLFFPTNLPLERWEKLLLLAFAGYFFVTAICHAINILGGTHLDPHWKLDNQLRWVAFVPIYLLFRTQPLLEKAFWPGISLGAFCSGALGLFYVPGHIPFGNISLLLGFMGILAIPFYRSWSKPLSWFPPIALLFGILGSILSEARGGWIALPLFCLLMIWRLLEKKKAAIRIGVTLLLVGVAIGGSLSLPSSPVLSRTKLAIEEVASYKKGDPKAIETSIGSRLDMWRCAWEIVKENPVFGAGIKSFHAERLQRIEDGMFRRPTDEYWSSFPHPHNTYLAILVESGIIGLFILLLVHLFPLFLFWKNRDQDVSWAGILLVTGYLIFGLTEHPFSRSPFTSFYLMMMALLLSRLRRSGQEKDRNASSMDSPVRRGE